MQILNQHNPNLATPVDTGRCFLCDDKGYIGTGTDVDSCPDCTTKAEMEYRAKKPKLLIGIEK